MATAVKDFTDRISLTEAHGLGRPFVFLSCYGKHIKQQGLPISLVNLQVLPLPPTSPSQEEEQCWQGKEVRVLALSLLRSLLLESFSPFLSLIYKMMRMMPILQG